MRELTGQRIVDEVRGVAVAVVRLEAGVQDLGPSGYHAVPSIRALNGAMLAPMAIAQFRPAARPAATRTIDSPSAPAATCWRSVRIESRLRTPTVIVTASNSLVPK